MAYVKKRKFNQVDFILLDPEAEEQRLTNIQKNLDLKLKKHISKIKFNRLIKKVVLKKQKRNTSTEVSNMAKAEANKATKEKKNGTSHSKIKCVKCGEMKSVRPEVYAKRIEAFGSEEKLLKNYLCQGCRPKKEKAKKEKTGKKKKEAEPVEEEE